MEDEWRMSRGHVLLEMRGGGSSCGLIRRGREKRENPLFILSASSIHPLFRKQEDGGGGRERGERRGGEVGRGRGRGERRRRRRRRRKRRTKRMRRRRRERGGRRGEDE
jgi:hypothetical protein